MSKLFPLFFLIVVLISSCEKNDSSNQQVLLENESLAIINNKKIFIEDFQQRYRDFLVDYKALIFEDKKNDLEIKKIIINKMIDEELMLQEASRKGIFISIEELESLTTTAIYPYPDAKFELKLTRSGSSVEDWQDRMRVYLTQKKLVEKEVLGKIPITKREVLNYYKKNKKKFYFPKKHVVRQIVSSSLSNAQAILRKLNGGASFTQMVRLHSIAPDKAVDGALGAISKGTLPLSIERAIFKLKRKNTLSRIITTQQGFHIFKLEKIYRKRKMKLSEAKSKIKSFLIEQKFEQFYKKWLEKLRNNARITLNQKLLRNAEVF